MKQYQKAHSGILTMRRTIRMEFFHISISVKTVRPSTSDLDVSNIVVPIKIQTDRKTTDDLGATLRACNAAANYMSTLAWESREFSKFGIHRLVYAKVKEEFGLGAQATVRTIAKVADAYNSGDQKFRRTRKRQFSWGSAQPFDARNLSWNLEDTTLSIWTMNGRAKAVPFLCADWALELLKHDPIAESDLVFRKGSFYIHATIDVEDETMNESPKGFLGVDMGIVNIATLSDGKNFSGKHLNQVRNRNLRLRRTLPKKGTRSAKRLLAKRSGREARFAKDTNHCISKKIVTEAQRTNYGISLEDLEGIRNRARLRKPQRIALNSWGFHQLGSFVQYKAVRAGVLVVYVNPAYTSQHCSGCGRVDKNNRPNQATFLRTSCGLSLLANRNATINIAKRGCDSSVVSYATARD